MPLLGTRLATALKADILTALQAAFPIPGGLLPAEQAMIQTQQTALATAIANGSGPDIIAEITTNALVATTDEGEVTTGVGAGGTVVGTGTGTVS
jgi:hypothetical protein